MNKDTAVLLNNALKVLTVVVWLGAAGWCLHENHTGFAVACVIGAAFAF